MSRRPRSESAAHPGEPGEPGEPGKPGKPGQPSLPGHPEVSGTPELGPSASAAATAPRPVRVLVVDGEAPVRRALAECLPAAPLVLLQAGSVAEARRQLAAGRVDLMLVDARLPDGSGTELAREAAQGRGQPQTIVLSNQPSLEGALQAMRSGASDFLAKPVDRAAVTHAVREALARRQTQRRLHGRLRHLRQLCQRLNAARVEVSQQVDVLCKDLVTAYHDLAQQMNQAVRTGDFAAIIGKELDLEQLLRRVLEYVLEKAGPTNAALFLPASDREFSLGGYINYDAADASPDVLLQHLADVVAPKVAGAEEPLHLTDNQQIADWIGDDAAYLSDCHVLSVACRHNGETLAVILIFRDAAQPYPAALVATLGAMAPVLGDYLARLIRIHHRHLPFEDGDEAEAA